MVRIIRRVIWLFLLVAVVWTACGQDESPPVRLDLIPTPDPAVNAALQALPSTNAYYYHDGLETMEETILNADVIARVSLVSKRPDVVQVDTKWFAVLEFRFRVHEYLKGSGSNEIGGLAWLSQSQATEADARTVAAQLPDAHDSRWDNREAIVFLEAERISRGPVLPGGSDRYWFGPLREGGGIFGISVASPHSKRWLPEVAKSASARTTASSEKLYLTDDPHGPETAYGQRVATRSPGSPLPTISLGNLKTRVATLEAEANAGGTALSRACIEGAYWSLRYVAYLVKARPGPSRLDFAIPSGLPAGTTIDVQEGPASKTPNTLGIWEFIGLDREMVRYDHVNVRPFETGSEYYAFALRLHTTRPLPADTYVYHPHWESPHCTKDLSAIATSTVVTLNVTAPARSVHEAFFDPVAIGEAVGSDDLSPADFSLDGSSTTTITSLKWEDGEVTMALSPTSTSLADYAIDFIDTIGTTTLSLTSDNASTTALTWTVPDKPWSDGDLLMLRIREPVPPEPVTVTITPRPQGALTYFDLAVSWTDPQACDGRYFVYVGTERSLIRNLGFHAPTVSTVTSSTGWLYDSVPDFWAIVRCDPSGGRPTREVGRASLRAAPQ